MAMGLLAMLSAVFFVILNITLSSFRNAVVRHNLQSDTQRISYRLSEDLRRSHYFTISKLDRTSNSGAFQRDALCIGGVKDWSANTAIDPDTSRPSWDGYVLYYCPGEVGDEPVQRLYRCWLRPAPTQVGQFAFPGLNPAVHCVPNPATCVDVEGFSLLSHMVESFQAEEAGNSQWRVSFRLRQQNAERRGNRSLDKVMDATIQLRPENTFPLYY